MIRPLMTTLVEVLQIILTYSFFFTITFSKLSNLLLMVANISSPIRARQILETKHICSTSSLSIAQYIPTELLVSAILILKKDGPKPRTTVVISWYPKLLQSMVWSPDNMLFGPALVLTQLHSTGLKVHDQQYTTLSSMHLVNFKNQPMQRVQIVE